MNIFDTHAHLLDEQFDADREQLLVSLPEQGITRVMEACCDEAGIDRVIELVARTPYFYGSAGVHPHSADEWKPETADHIRAALGHERMVAIGEIGLDYHYDFSPRETQRDCFDAQLALAAELRRPVIIHDREAHGDTMDLLRHYRGRLSGVMHCFSASYEIAKECIDLGLYIAFGGALTFKNAVNQWAIAAKLPLDRLLIETDCPYMTPVPFRGKRNDPSLIVYTLDKLSELRGADREALAEILYDNSFRAFGIEQP
jgi:TatD DNase family protein